MSIKCQMLDVRKRLFYIDFNLIFFLNFSLIKLLGVMSKGCHREMFILKLSKMPSLDNVTNFLIILTSSFHCETNYVPLLYPGHFFFLKNSPSLQNSSQWCLQYLKLKMVLLISHSFSVT